MSETLYLVHHGILGQKWGVRRFQNPDGSLTAAGRKRYGVDGNGRERSGNSSDSQKLSRKKEKQIRQYNKNFEKAYSRAVEDYSKNQEKLYVKAYNRMADRANAGLTEKFNTDWENKHGKDFGEAYEEAYMEYFGKILNEEFVNVSREYMANNGFYIAARSLVESYGSENLNSANLKMYEDISDFFKD